MEPEDINDLERSAAQQSQIAATVEDVEPLAMQQTAATIGAEEEQWWHTTVFDQPTASTSSTTRYDEATSSQHITGNVVSNEAGWIEAEPTHSGLGLGLSATAMDSNTRFAFLAANSPPIAAQYPRGDWPVQMLTMSNHGIITGIEIVLNIPNFRIVFTHGTDMIVDTIHNEVRVHIHIFDIYFLISSSQPRINYYKFFWGYVLLRLLETSLSQEYIFWPLYVCILSSLRGI